MQALGILSPVLEAESKIQSYVAKFLATKEKITKLMKHPSLTISSRAGALMTIQRQLETDLQNALAVIERMKASGIPSFSDLAYIVNFGVSLEVHMKSVSDLEKNAQSSGLVIEEPIYTKPWFMGAMVGLGAVLIYTYYK